MTRSWSTVCADRCRESDSSPRATTPAAGGAEVLVTLRRRARPPSRLRSLRRSGGSTCSVPASTASRFDVLGDRLVTCSQGASGPGHRRVRAGMHAGVREAAPRDVGHRTPRASGTWPRSGASRAAPSASSASAPSARRWPTRALAFDMEVRRPPSDVLGLLRSTGVTARRESRTTSSPARTTWSSPPRRRRDRPPDRRRRLGQREARGPPGQRRRGAPSSTRTRCVRALDDGRVAMASLDVGRARTPARRATPSTPTPGCTSRRTSRGPRRARSCGPSRSSPTTSRVTATARRSAGLVDLEAGY